MSCLEGKKIQVLFYRDVIIEMSCSERKEMQVLFYSDVMQMKTKGKTHENTKVRGSESK